MNKKAQMTIFFIVGLMLLIAMVFYATYSKPSKIIQDTSSSQDIRTQIGSCFKSVAEDALLHVTIVGPNGEIYALFEIADHMKQYIKDNLMNCLDKSLLAKLTYDAYAINPDVMLADDRVEFSLDWPITVNKLNSQQKINGFSKPSYYVRLPKMYDTALDIIMMSKIKGSLIMSYYPMHNDIDVIITKDSNGVIYKIIDTKSTIRSQYYTIQLTYG